MSLRPCVFLVCIATTALVAVGCGGDDGGDNSAEAFTEEVNQVCLEAKEDIEAAGANGEKLIAAGEAFVADLKAVDPPSDKQDAYESWVAGQEDYFKQVETAIRTDDEQAANSLEEGTGDQQARDLGLDDCVG